MMKTMQIVLVGCATFLADGAISAQQPAIINNPAPNVAAPTLRVSPPIMKVGGVNDNERLEILAVSWAELNSKGQLLVVPRVGTPPTCGFEIRVFDQNSRFLRSIGRRGQGPGEFSCIQQFALFGGDTIVVRDGESGFTLMDSTGNLISIRNLPELSSTYCCFMDRTLLFASLNTAFYGGRGLGNRPVVPHSILQLVGDTTPRPSVKLIYGDSALRIPSPRGGSRIPGAPFARRPHVAITANEIIYGLGDRFEYSVYATDGRLLRTVRTAVPNAAVTSQDITEWRNGLLEVGRRAGMEAEFRRAVDQAKIPATHPAFSAIRAERDGTVWVRSYSKTNNAAEYWWARYDREGRLTGTLKLPPDRILVQFTNGHVILRETDPLGAVILYVHKVVASG